jgi:hypothetical protein
MADREKANPAFGNVEAEVDAEEQQQEQGRGANELIERQDSNRDLRFDLRGF